MTSVALALIQHDPRGLLFDQTVRVFPTLQQPFADIAVQASAATAARSLDYLRQHNVRVEAETTHTGFGYIGRFRRATVELALRGTCDFVMYCDFDRALHWAEYYPQELREVVRTITACDFTVLGRTPRAFATHPRIQRDTEAIINHVFG